MSTIPHFMWKFEAASLDREEEGCRVVSLLLHHHHGLKLSGATDEFYLNELNRIDVVQWN